MAQEGCSKEKGKTTKSGTKTMERDLSLRNGVGEEESANDTWKKKSGKEAEHEGCVDTEGSGGEGSVSFSSAQRYKQSKTVKLRPAPGITVKVGSHMGNGLSKGGMRSLPKCMPSSFRLNPSCDASTARIKSFLE